MPRTHVLLLEDNAEHAERVMEWLRQASGHVFTVDHVSTLEEARVVLSVGAYDVGLVDLCTPDSRGLATFRTVRRAPDLPIVVQSGLEAEQTALDALRLGAQDYLVKRHMSAPLVCRALFYARERARSEQALRESRERYERAVEGARDGIWEWCLTTDTIAYSRRWLAMLGHDHDGLGDSPEDWFALVHPDDIAALLRAIHDHIQGVSAHLEHEYRIRTANDAWRWVLVRAVAARTEDGVALTLAGSQTDIHARKEDERRLVHLAMHDQLTGLPNRALLLDRLSLAMRRSARHDTHRYSLLFIDLDRFKLINDSLGHLVGDQVLVAAGERIRSSVRPGDTVARLGGDEFAVLLEDLDPAGRGITALSTTIAGRIHRGLARTVLAEGHEVNVSASIGIAAGDPSYTTPEEALRDADIAMYESKSSGRAGHAVFDRQLRDAAVNRLALERSLRSALERHEYVVHYQPIVRLEDGEVVSVEALVRWLHPERGLLPPSHFIEQAEQTGHIEGIGRFVLRRACEDLAAMRAQAGHQDLHVSVNLSARQLRDPGLVDMVADTLAETGLPGSALALELTETAVVESLDHARRVLGRLRDLDVRLHLDDFGAGYSSLSYLRQLPIDLLKIDRAFVSGLGAGVRDQAIVRAVLGIAESLDMGVIAEGVETEGQRSRLQALRCPLAQGYFFGRPSAAGPVARWLGAQQRRQAAMA